jgi:hypothetical protein
MTCVGNTSAPRDFYIEYEKETTDATNDELKTQLVSRVFFKLYSAGDSIPGRGKGIFL